MGRARPPVQAFGGDGPIFVAIMDVLIDIHDLLDARLPRSSEGPVRISEPAPAGPPPRAVPVSEPAPDEPPQEDGEAASEPAPDLPPTPPRAGRGSSQQAWAAWARHANVAVTDDMSRDDIINACVSAGVLSR